MAAMQCCRPNHPRGPGTAARFSPQSTPWTRRRVRPLVLRGRARVPGRRRTLCAGSRLLFAFCSPGTAMIRGPPALPFGACHSASTAALLREPFWSPVNPPRPDAGGIMPCLLVHRGGRGATVSALCRVRPPTQVRLYLTWPFCARTRAPIGNPVTSPDAVLFPFDPFTLAQIASASPGPRHSSHSGVLSKANKTSLKSGASSSKIKQRDAARPIYVTQASHHHFST
jgi:hypothetical protein